MQAQGNVLAPLQYMKNGHAPFVTFIKTKKATRVDRLLQNSSYLLLTGEYSNNCICGTAERVRFF